MIFALAERYGSAQSAVEVAGWFSGDTGRELGGIWSTLRRPDPANQHHSTRRL